MSNRAARRRAQRERSRMIGKPAAPAPNRQPAAPAREAALDVGWRDELRALEAELVELDRRRRDLRRAAARLANQAVRRGSTWSEVGVVLGISRQAARKRYAGEPIRGRATHRDVLRQALVQALEED